MILRRLDGSRFSEVLPAWKGKTAVLIGGGPSLDMGDVDLVGRAHASGLVQCIAINDAYLCAPWADVLYAADAKWHAWHTQGIPKPHIGLTAEQVRERFKSFAGQKCSIKTQQNRITDDAVHLLKNKHGDHHGTGLSDDPQYIVTGSHGGHQALNVAILAGASTVLLLGFDGRGINGRTHWHGGHPESAPANDYASRARSWTESQHAIRATGVKIINCSLVSKIDHFPKMPLVQALVGELAVV